MQTMQLEETQYLFFFYNTITIQEGIIRESLWLAVMLFPIPKDTRGIVSPNKYRISNNYLVLFLFNENLCNYILHTLNVNL